MGGFSKRLSSRKNPSTSIGTKRLEVGSFKVVAGVRGVLKDPGASHPSALSSPAAGFWPQTPAAGFWPLVSAAAVPHIMCSRDIDQRKKERAQAKGIHHVKLYVSY